jgi:CBS domain-containing protein
MFLSLKASVDTTMRSPPVTALFSDKVFTIVERMISNNIGGVIVMSGGVPTGLITERDIIEKVIRNRKDLDKTIAQDIMSPLVTVDSETTIQNALKLMRDKKTRRFAVAKKGRLVGIVTERRLLDSLVG